jgi:hypothetical protein
MQPHRAEPPRGPVASPAQQREIERMDTRDARLRLERRSLLRGLLLIAVLVLLASLMRAEPGRLFVHGWWRQW